jgi:hypothetical protein
MRDGLQHWNEPPAEQGQRKITFRTTARKIENDHKLEE